MKKIRCAVIGLGMGRGHVRGYQSHPAAEVVALADPDEERLRRAGEEFGVSRLYTDARRMLHEETLDVVSVATPNKFHKPLTIAALEAGCHVLCEKPMALNAREARVMLAAAARTGRRLMINFSFRFTDQALALKHEVEAGTLGEIYFGRTVWHRRRGLPRFGSWFGQKEVSGGGPLIDLGVHRLDLALWFMNYPEPEWVLAATYDPIARRLAKERGVRYDVEDLAAAMIRFRNGASLVLEASWASNQRENELMETRLYGTKGGLIHFNVEETYRFEAELFVERGGVQHDMKLHPPVPGSTSSYFHFIDAIANDRPHIATGEEGLRVMELLDAVYRSAARGRPVRLGK